MKGRIKQLVIVSLLGVTTLFRLQAQVKEPVDYVDPFIGTDFFGHTYPGPAFPFGMIHPGPDVNDHDWTYAAGYLYSESSIMGFSHTHWSGTGMVNGGDILIMPQVSLKLKTMPGTLEKPEGGYRSSFDHDNETASPGYYSVLLKDYNVRAELTCTKRAAMHRYTFPKSDNSRIILDLGHQLGSNSSQEESELRIIDDSRIEGVKSNGMGKIWFVAVFSKKFDYYGTFDNEYETPESGGSIWPYKNGEKGKGIGAFLDFRTKENEQILVRLAISYVSLEGARKK
jgi:putative alpha-1,2-mannosidase